MRVAIAGGPRTGKTTLAGDDALHTDDQHGDWHAVSDTVATWFDEPGPLTVEGCRVAHALRKWLANNPDGRPVDRVIIMDQPQAAITKHQAAMALGIRAIMDEIQPELERRGVVVERR